ncbi:putative mRNA 3-end processing factor [Sphingomonas laterariae]|uniref:Putative mRNA 3-end processing factor n=1 Tax=Edaphosphingomonas laterariae TaxID=861865 RepID=A0A239I2D8_9SPHN|nr:ligase-associated DNA damage response exonuclease [Sphingomonas laterariae]SNS87689.1 putative mRNA 3-end processing factor [Sphingomonas laterariae]
MVKDFSWLRAEPHGIYIVPASCWIDPAQPVDSALITHGHADHARGGHGTVMATPATLAIMALRYGDQALARTIEYGERLRLPGGVDATFLPAGHVLGSAQILLEHAGERILVTGDYKRRRDPTCPPFTAVPCDILVTEATFALPVFRHPPVEHEIARLIDARAANPNRCLLLGAYALGKAQRIIAELRLAGYSDPIWLHGALERMCRLYEAFGASLGELRLVSEARKDDLAGQIVLCPPGSLNDRWSRRLPDPLTAMASGWMRVRQRARQRNVELPLIISDHADWDELTGTIDEIDPVETWITHGREDALIRWCALHGRRARALALAGYDDEDD